MKMSNRNTNNIALDKGVFGKHSFVNKNYELLDDALSLNKRTRGYTLLAFVRQKMAIGGLIILIVMIMCALVLPLFSQNAKTIDPYNVHQAIFSKGHIFGTDFLGRDIWARTWTGLRFSLGIAAMAVLVDLILGYVIGMCMGYFKRFDTIMQFVIKIFVNIPSIILLLIITLILRPSFWTIVLGLTITGWIGMASQVRAWVFRTKNMEWVVASRTLGTSQTKILFKKITPHIVPIIVAQLIFTIPAALIGDLSLSVLGLAIPNVSSLGSLLAAGQKFILIYPMEAAIPIMVVSIMLISIQFVGFGVQKVVGRSK